MKNTTDILPDPLPDTFDALNMIHQLRPIRDEVDYENAVTVADRIAVLNIRTQDQDDYLETLSELIGKFDDEHYASNLEHLTPIDSLMYLMEQNALTPTHLGDILEKDSDEIRKILKGESELDKTHVRILSEHFKVNPRLFL